MQQPVITPHVTLANRELQKLIEPIANSAVLAAIKVSALEEFKPQRGSFEEIFAERFKEFDSSKKKQIAAKARALYRTSDSVRAAIFGSAAKVDFRGAPKLEAELDKLGLPKINRKALGMWDVPANAKISENEKNELYSRYQNVFNLDELITPDAITGNGPVMEIGVDDEEEETGSPTMEPQMYVDKLGFYIRRVKCVDETNPEWWGSDEIGMAGISVDETGDTKKIGETYIGGGFDDGDTKWYSPNWFYHWFSLNEGGNNWPKTYYMTLILAEKDNGGLSSFLNKLWEKVRDKVKAAITAAVGGALGEVLGPLGPIIGAAIAWAVDYIVGWLISLWEDDIFPPQTVGISIPSHNCAWYYNGGWKYYSPYYRMHFYGHGGHYYVEYRWRLYS